MTINTINPLHTVKAGKFYVGIGGFFNCPLTATPEEEIKAERVAITTTTYTLGKKYDDEWDFHCDWSDYYECDTIEEVETLSKRDFFTEEPMISEDDDILDKDADEDDIFGILFTF